MIGYADTKHDKDKNRQGFYAYAANKAMIDWKDYRARWFFEQKPWYLVEKEKIDELGQED